MTADVRYLDYFSATIFQQAKAGRTDRQNIAHELLARIEAKLTADGHAADVIAREMTLARAAAAAVANAAEPSDTAAEASAANADLAGAAPRPRRFRALHVILAIIAIVAYATPLTLFLRQGDEATSNAGVGRDQVAIALNIGVTDLAQETVTFHIVPTAGALMQPNQQLSHDLTLEIDPGTGPVTHTFHAHSVLAPWTLKAATDKGDILDYPFDRYELELEMAARSEGQDVKLTTRLEHVAHGLSAARGEEVDETGRTTASVSLRRSGTIVFIALLTAISLLLVTIAACTVSWHAAYRGRKLEISMLIWTAALMFVIPTVRRALPGDAPPGALIDFLVFFWLQIAVAIATSALVVTWVKRAET